MRAEGEVVNFADDGEGVSCVTTPHLMNSLNKNYYAVGPSQAFVCIL